MSLLVVLLFEYYVFQKELIIKNYYLQSEQEIATLASKLKQLHFSNDELLLYPRFENFKSSIYDIDKNPIFEQFKVATVDFDQSSFVIQDKLYFIHKNTNYFLGVAYIIIEKPLPKELSQLIQNIIVVFVCSSVFIILISYFLSKMFLKPLKETISLLDNFIKDTTHELNTPINTIKANIELLETTSLNEQTHTKIKRIKLASNSIVNIYEDMIYSVFKQDLITKNELLDLKTIIEDRLELFDIAIKAKKIQLTSNLNQCVINMDKHKFCKVFDNLLSNAIKYNKVGGCIDIKLDQHRLIIEDSGEGVSEEAIEKIFDRFTRFSKNAGGFGIGLNIVKLILDEYHIKITFNSQKNIGTKVVLTWSK